MEDQVGDFLKQLAAKLELVLSIVSPTVSYQIESSRYYKIVRL